MTEWFNTYVLTTNGAILLANISAAFFSAVFVQIANDVMERLRGK